MLLLLNFKLSTLCRQFKVPSHPAGNFAHQLLGGVNRDLLTILAQTLETDYAVSGGKQSVVGTDAHVGAGMNVGAALAHQNVASQNELTVSPLGPKTLGLRVTAVLGGAHTFFMGEELQTNVQHHSVHPFYKMIGEKGAYASITSICSGYSS